MIYCRRENIQVKLPVIGFTNFPLLCKFYRSTLPITSIFQLEVKHKQLEEWRSNLCVRLAHIKRVIRAISCSCLILIGNASICAICYDKIHIRIYFLNYPSCKMKSYTLSRLRLVKMITRAYSSARTLKRYDHTKQRFSYYILVANLWIFV